MTDNTDPIPPALPEDPKPAPKVEKPSVDPSSHEAILGRAGLFGALTGGALAAMGGFALSHYNALSLRPEIDTAALTQAMDALSARLQDQSNEVAAVRAATEALTADLAGSTAELTSRIASTETAMTGALEQRDERLTALDGRMAEIEALPADGSDATTTALTAKVNALDRKVAELARVGADLPADISAEIEAAMARIDAAETRAAAQAAEAEAAAELARQRAAVDRLRAAIESGVPYSALLTDLPADRVPPVLAENAAAGIVTRASLQEGFPDAARAALMIARANDAADQGWGTRLVNFLQAQTGARSLTPREGTDPDAILSRSEAALADGRLADALAELEGLDPAVRAPLTEWIARASLRLEAEQAVAALLASVEG
ncbi:MAG: hypothetical protein HC844_12265 [Tabrizicola sp.]|nr:hypothetical protein [Tabrizicola sp.]